MPLVARMPRGGPDPAVCACVPHLLCWPAQHSALPRKRSLQQSMLQLACAGSWLVCKAVWLGGRVWGVRVCIPAPWQVSSKWNAPLPMSPGPIWGIYVCKCFVQQECYVLGLRVQLLRVGAVARLLC